MVDEVLERITKIEERLDFLEKTISSLGHPSSVNMLNSIDLSELLDLPSSLQKTMLAVQELNEATASEVAQKTGRDRTIESIYLNQLMRLGHLNRERKGRKIHFKVMKYY